MARRDIEIFNERSFGVVHDTDEKPNTINFKLHNHDDIYEVVLLLSGDCEFNVEGNVYRFQDGDIVFTRPFELHRVVCISEKIYDRIILYIKSDYFKKHSCEHYLDIFQNREIGTGNLIPHSMSDYSLNECIKRLLKYCDEGEYDVADNVVYEFLYLINRYKNNPVGCYTKDERVRNIIMYINDNLSETLNLDVLSKKFFITKQYMCQLFKRSTGYTINHYISYKRILLVKELYRSGQSLMEASMNAGFNSYANFYKTYVRLTGETPRQMN